jgi:hypothetical protein
VAAGLAEKFGDPSFCCFSDLPAGWDIDFKSNDLASDLEVLVHLNDAALVVGATLLPFASHAGRLGLPLFRDRGTLAQRGELEVTGLRPTVAWGMARLALGPPWAEEKREQKEQKEQKEERNVEESRRATRRQSGRARLVVDPMCGVGVPLLESACWSRRTNSPVLLLGGDSDPEQVGRCATNLANTAAPLLWDACNLPLASGRADERVQRSRPLSL